jgi:hypothetical protein
MSERILGETDEEFSLDRSEPLRDICVALATQARRSVDIVTRSLDPVLYDNDGFITALRDLVVGSRHARVRVLILDSASVVSRGHRLLELAQRLSSFISLRVPAPEHKDFNEAWLVVDNTGYVHRRFSVRFEAVANFDARRISANLTNRFEELWNHAQLEPNLRRLHL